MAIDEGLLIHWWHYYGKKIYTLEELKQFKEIINKYGVEKVLDAAIASYICSDGSPTIMLESIREGVVDEMFDSLPKIEDMSEENRETYALIKEDFLNQISETYG